MIILSKNKAIASLILCSIFCLLLVLHKRLLFCSMDSKIIASHFGKGIIHYLANQSSGVSLAFQHLNFSQDYRGAPSAILTISQMNGIDDRLDTIIWATATEENVVRIIEAIRIKLKRMSAASNKLQEMDLYINRLYQLVYDPHKYKNARLYEFEIYYGRLSLLQYSENKLDDELFEKLVECPRNQRYPKEIDKFFR